MPIVASPLFRHPEILDRIEEESIDIGIFFILPHELRLLARGVVLLVGVIIAGR